MFQAFHHVFQSPYIMSNWFKILGLVYNSTILVALTNVLSQSSVYSLITWLTLSLFQLVYWVYIQKTFV